MGCSLGCCNHTGIYMENPAAENGAMPGTVIKDGTRTTDHLVRIVTVVCVLLIVLQIYKIFRLYKPTAKKLAKLKEKAEKKAAKQGNT